MHQILELLLYGTISIAVYFVLPSGWYYESYVFERKILVLVDINVCYQNANRSLVEVESYVKSIWCVLSKVICDRKVVFL